MRKTKLFHFILIAFVMLAYQASTFHFEHLLEKNDKCHDCLANKELDSVLHEITYIVDTQVYDNSSIEQKVSKPKARKLTHKPIPKTVDFTGLCYFSVPPIPLGYFSNAPPSSLS